MSVDVRAIREDEREECLDLWCTVWPGDNRGYFQRYFYGDVEWQPDYTQVGVLDGRLVSAVHICKRTVACGDFRLTMGGIANVATLPEYRGKGYNTLCLERAIAVMEADAMDFSLLGTGINGYYARLGYATLPRRWVKGRVRADLSPRSTPYTVRAATEADLTALRAIYVRSNQKRPIAVQRHEAYWRDWMGLSSKGMPETLLVAISPEGEVHGYVYYEKHGDHLALNELGSDADTFVGGCRPIVTALLDAVGTRALAESSPEIHARIAFEPAVLQALEGILEEREWQTANGSMVRLLHRDNLLRSFLLELNDRWLAAGRPGGVLGFATPYGPIRLDAGGSFLQVAPAAEGAEAMPQETLFGLLFGALSPAQATVDTALHPLIAALFPSQAWVYWSMDGF